MDKTWETPRATACAVLVGAAVLAGGATWMAIKGDPVGLVLFTAVTVGVAYMGVSALLLRPRLRVDGSGVTVRGLRGSAHLPWDEVAVKLNRSRHWGRESVTLELERGDDLFLLGRWELGDAPTAVHAEVLALRP